MKFSHILSALISVLALVGCSDPSIITNDIGSSLEYEGEYKISTFTISNETMVADLSLQDAVVVLTPLTSGGRSLEYSAKTEVSLKAIKCRMHIPQTETIPNGTYTMSLRLSDGTKLGGILRVTFKDDMLLSAELESIEYTKLSGEGTMEKPYLINSKTDFTSFINNLRRDSITHGAGRYFKQTATFDAPTQSELYDGRGYYNYGFAGSYDGGGFAIENIYYIGNSSPDRDCCIGLFTSLYDGAEIKNLKIDNVSIQNTAADCGSLAGKAMGNIRITNVKVKGIISSGGIRCGGLIGSLDGHLTIEGYDFNLMISGTSEVGGALGRAYDGSVVRIHNVTTDEHRFSISGNDNVGGLIGRMSGEFHLAHIELEHTVSGEDSDLKIISADGINQGGAIGLAENITAACNLDSILIECPVGGSANCVGGIVGRMESDFDVSVKLCRMTSLVTGNISVGGLFGHVKMLNGKYLNITGDSRVAADESAGSVKGVSKIGGAFGYLEGNIGHYGRIRVAINVTGTSDYTGGLIGYFKDSYILLEYFPMESQTMRVEGADYVGGLIGCAENSTIEGPYANEFKFNKSLASVPKSDKFESSYIGLVNGNNYIGGLIGKLSGGSLLSVSTNCTVTVSGEFAGGIVGLAELSGSNSTLNNCVFIGTLTNTKYRTGGIAGRIKGAGSVQNCINYGSISGGSDTGGIAGHVDYSNGVPDFDFCVNKGRISASGSSTGGIVGYLSGNQDKKEYMHIDHSANYGEVSNTSDSDNSGVGGIVGYCASKRICVWHSANHGKISSTSRQHGIGGIAGSLGQDPGGANASANLEVGWCCNRGEITSSYSGNTLGGILGYQEEGGSDKHDHDSWLHDCINFGPVSSKQDKDNGGILGKIDSYGYIQNCVNFGKVSHGNGVVGTHKNACIWNHDNLYFLKDSGKEWESTEIYDSNKGQASTYKGFDFNNTWYITGGYPALIDCPFQF